VHGSLARAGKVKSQTPKVEKQEEEKAPRSALYNRRQVLHPPFVNVMTIPGVKRRM
ncbi:ribosomal protein S30, partial [Boletus edulis]